MINTICLDKNYSTTRLVTKERPEIVNSPTDKFETVLFLSRDLFFYSRVDDRLKDRDIIW